MTIGTHSIRKTLGIPVLLISAGFFFIQFALPIYGKKIGANAFEIGGVISVFGLVITILRPMVGYGIDHFGRKPFLLAALAFYTLSLTTFGISSDLIDLFIAQILRGTGSALLWVTAYTIATDISPVNERGTAVGIVDESSGRGGLIGGIIGITIFSILQDRLGWQIPFHLYTASGILAIGYTWLKLPETKPASTINPHLQEVVPAMLYKLLIIVFITSTSSSMLAPIIIIFLQDRFTSDVGMIALASIPAGIIIATLPSRLGKLSDRYGRTNLMAIGLLGSAILSLFIPTVSSLWILAILWTVESLGWAIAAPAEEAMVADLTGHLQRGKAYGFYMFAASLGAIIGPLAGGWMYEQFGQGLPFYINAGILIAAAVFIGYGMKFTHRI